VFGGTLFSPDLAVGLDGCGIGSNCVIGVVAYFTGEGGRLKVTHGPGRPNFFSKLSMNSYTTKAGTAPARRIVPENQNPWILLFVHLRKSIQKSEYMAD